MNMQSMNELLFWVYIAGAIICPIVMGAWLQPPLDVEDGPILLVIIMAAIAWPVMAAWALIFLLVWMGKCLGIRLEQRRGAS